MADQNFYLDPEGLGAANEQIRKIQADLQAEYDKLIGAVDEHYGCWGTDDAGKAFEKNFKESEGPAREGGQAINDGTRELSKSVDAAIDKFNEVDKQNADQINNS